MNCLHSNIACSCITYCWSLQGIVYLNRNRNSATFLSYVCNAKKIKELFYPTLHGITASVSFVSLLLVVLDARQPANGKRRLHSNKHGHCRVFPKVSHCYLSPFAVFTMQSVVCLTGLLSILLIYASQQKHTSMLGKGTRLQVIPQQSPQTPQTCGYRHMTKTSGLF